jgi:hypothetical protein
MKEFIKKTTLSISEHLYPLFTNQLLRHVHDLNDHTESYLYLLKWIKGNLENKNVNEDNDVQVAIELGHTFIANLDNLINEYFSVKSQYRMTMTSIRTSLEIYKHFDTLKEACEAHILNVVLQTINLLEWKDKFSNRIAETPEEAYPPDSRPRGEIDLISIEYHRSLLREGKEVVPVWFIYKDNELSLMDGQHRVVACYIEKKYDVPANVVYV